VHLAYLTALTLAISGLAALDFRHRLAFFGGSPRRTAVVLTISVAFFLLWDVVGIAHGIFFRGSGPWMTGILIAPELPVEEILFLIVLSYSTLVVYLWVGKLAANKGLS